MALFALSAPCNADEPKSGLTQSLDRLAAAVENASKATKGVAAKMRQVAPAELWGLGADLSRCNDSVQSTGKSLSAARHNPEPANLYQLRNDLGELNKHMNALTLRVTLKGTELTKPEQRDSTALVDSLNESLRQLDVVTFLYDLQVYEVLGRRAPRMEE